MATTRLTQARITALRPRKTARDIRDASLRGFGVRVYPAGRKCHIRHSQVDGSRIGKIADDARGQARARLAVSR